MNIKLFSHISTHQKILIAKNLSAMLGAGLSISRALTVLERQTKHQRLKEVLNNIGKEISGGATLYSALENQRGVFSPLFIAMTRAGEESGSLVESLKTVSVQMERSYELIRKIRGALMYPSVIVTAMGGIAFFMLAYVVPQITATFKELNVELPISTKIVIAVSDLLKNHWLLVIIVFACTIVGLYFGSKTSKGGRIVDTIILHIPIVSTLVKHTNSAQTTRTLSSLLTAGVDVLVAIDITIDVIQNSYYKNALRDVRGAVEKGEPIAVIFTTYDWLYPAFVSEMVAVGEETGQLAPMLANIAVFYETEVEQKTKDMSTIIEPFLIVLIGVAVGFFAVSMIGPIYSIGDAIQ